MNIDVCYKIGWDKKWKDYECLRYSIRSAAKNFKNLRNVVIVGELPDWASSEIVHIKAHDPYKDKDSNIIHKLLITSREESISDDFVNMSDDQFFLQPVNLEQLYPYNLDSDLEKMAAVKKVSPYGKKIQNTLRILGEQGLPTHDYECHIPMLINKAKYLEILSSYAYDKDMLCGNTIYFNNLEHFKEIPVENVRAYFRRQTNKNNIERLTKGKLFLNLKKTALNEPMKNFIQGNFPEKTKYER